jgi:hypothetical protein
MTYSAESQKATSDITDGMDRAACHVRGRGCPRKTASLSRTTFTTSRLLEFCTRKELTIQTGHPVEAWPLVELKEVVDNALDAAEEAGEGPLQERQHLPWDAAVAMIANHSHRE